MFAELQKTFASGKTTKLEWRKSQLQALAKGLKERHDDICKAMYEDLRRPALEALQAEVMSTLNEVILALKSVPKWMEPVEVETPKLMEPAKSYIISKPKAAIIAAGNCCVIKPSEMVPASAKLIKEIIEKYLDPSAFRVVLGGNGKVGRLVMTAAAQHLASVTLELGGKSPVYVHSDANLDVAARRVVSGKFVNGGQVCVAPDYLIVHEKVREELLEKLKETILKFYGENPKDAFARIVNVHHFDRIKKLIEEDKHGGKTIVGGLQGADRENRYIPPTMILDPSRGSNLMKEEIFGPILPILTVSSFDKAIELINSQEPSLAAYVFTEDEKVAEAFMQQIQTGGGCINETISHIGNPNLPFNGCGPSGQGAYHGKFGFDSLSNKQSIFKRPTDQENMMRYPPFPPQTLALLKSML